MTKPFTPSKTDFMDEPMHKLWNQMGALPAELRLYGGAALALYLDHRGAPHFSFATPQTKVDRDLARQIPWLRGARLSGGPGMVDAVIESGRMIQVTLMETGVLVPNPQETPIEAPNGVMVAHPKDLVRAKIEACLSRDTARDFIDMAQCTQAWPKLTRDAVETHIENSGRTHQRVSATLNDPPHCARAELDRAQREALQALAQAVHRPTRAQWRTHCRGRER